MAMMPKRVKYRKAQRGKIREVATRGNTVAFGEFGLQSLEHGWLTARQIEAGRMAATHYLHARAGCTSACSRTSRCPASRWKRVWARARASRSTGSPIVKPGTMMFEIGGVAEDVARRALTRVAHKMPFRCRFVIRRHAV